MIKKILRWTGIVLGTILLVLAIAIVFRQHLTYDKPYPDIKASTDSAVIARGKYLAYGPAHCVECHYAKGAEARVIKGEQVELSGGTPFNLPIGAIYPKNITTDKATGIGNLSDQEIARALRYGVRADGTALFDFMPFHNTCDEDLTAIISFLRTQQPVHHEVPANKMNLLGYTVNAFLIKPVGPDGKVATTVTRDTSAIYGKYLANSVANCRGCHTNRDLMTGAFIGKEYAGGFKMESAIDPKNFSVITPNLTPDATGVIHGWSQQQFIQRFRQGKIIPHSPMPWIPFSRMSDDELKAIYNFLQTLKPEKNEVKQTLVSNK